MAERRMVAALDLVVSVQANAFVLDLGPRPGLHAVSCARSENASYLRVRGVETTTKPRCGRRARSGFI